MSDSRTSCSSKHTSMISIVAFTAFYAAFFFFCILSFAASRRIFASSAFSMAAFKYVRKVRFLLGYLPQHYFSFLCFPCSLICSTVSSEHPLCLHLLAKRSHISSFFHRGLFFSFALSFCYFWYCSILLLHHGYVARHPLWSHNPKRATDTQ